VEETILTDCVSIILGKFTKSNDMDSGGIFVTITFYF
jgi:hypothetical protein